LIAAAVAAASADDAAAAVDKTFHQPVTFINFIHSFNNQVRQVFTSNNRAKFYPGCI